MLPRIEHRLQALPAMHACRVRHRAPASVADRHRLATQVGNIKDNVGGMLGNNEMQVRRAAPALRSP